MTLEQEWLLRLAVRAVQAGRKYPPAKLEIEDRDVPVVACMLIARWMRGGAKLS